MLNVKMNNIIFQTARGRFMICEVENVDSMDLQYKQLIGYLDDITETQSADIIGFHESLHLSRKTALMIFLYNLKRNMPKNSQELFSQKNAYLLKMY